MTKIVRKQNSRILDGGLTLDLNGNPDKVVLADPHQLRRAISQLLDNAINGTPRGGRIAIDIGRKRRRDADRHLGQWARDEPA